MALRMRALGAALLVTATLPAAAGAQATPPRGPDEGKGPYNKLVIRGVNVIDGAGGTARGPMRHRDPGQPDHRGPLGGHAGAPDGAQPAAARRRL